MSKRSFAGACRLDGGIERLLCFEVTRHPTAEWLARKITEAFPWGSAPRYLVRDNDGAYGHVIIRRLQAMGICDRPISPRSPWQNGYVERLIGTVRRECLDRVLVGSNAHLKRILTTYAAYYNQVRAPSIVAYWAACITSICPDMILGMDNDPEPLSRRDLCSDCIIVTLGYDFQGGQACIINMPGYDFWNGQPFMNMDVIVDDHMALLRFAQPEL